MLITPFYWLMAPWYRRCERTTIGEMMEDRYGRGMAMLYTRVRHVLLRLQPGHDDEGGGQGDLVRPWAREAISPNEVVVAMVAAFLALQLLRRPGRLGLHRLRPGLPDHRHVVHAHPGRACGPSADSAGMRASSARELLRSLQRSPAASDGFTILMLTLNGFIGITAQPHILTMNATGRTERAGRVGQTYGSIVKRVLHHRLGLTGLIVAAMVVQQGTQPGRQGESASATPACTCSARASSGLMVACVLAANMSTCSNFMVNAGALFTRELLQHLRAAQAQDKEVLLVGRLSGLALTLFGRGVRPLRRTRCWTPSCSTRRCRRSWASP